MPPYGPRLVDDISREGKIFLHTFDWSLEPVCAVRLDLMMRGRGGCVSTTASARPLSPEQDTLERPLSGNAWLTGWSGH